MPNFITKILIANFLSNFKVVELEHEFEPGDLGLNCVPLWCCYPWLCVSLLVPYSLGNHARLGGGNVAERLKSTWAYGWVERCSDVAGCRTSSY